MNRKFLTTAVMAGVTALVVPAIAVTTATAAPPVPIDVGFLFPGAFAQCGFDVLAVITGKTKVIDLPGGRQIITAPAERATLTKEGHGGASVTYVITGTFHNETLPNGNVVTKVTGRTVLSDPIAGFVLTSGNFSFTTAPDGSIVVPLQGEGSLTNICAALS